MQCPICKKTISDTPQDLDRRFLPFCGERCKLIDLGRWLGGRYQIPVAPDDAGETSASQTDADVEE